MKSVPKISLIVIASLFLFACSNDGSEQGSVEGENPSKTVLPVAAEVPGLEEAALKGSPVAALRLSLWHSHHLREEKGIYWARIAAENGSPAAQFNYAIVLSRDRSNKYNLYRARFWLQRSAAQGSKQAEEKLKEIQ